MDAEVHPQQAVALGVDARTHLIKKIVTIGKRQDLLHGHGHGCTAGLLLPHLTRHTAGRLMGRYRVHAVVDVFQVHLPVASHGVAQNPTGHFQSAHGRALHHVVNGTQSIAKVSVKVQAFRAQTHKDKFAVNVHTG